MCPEAQAAAICSEPTNVAGVGLQSLGKVQVVGFNFKPQLEVRDRRVLVPLSLHPISRSHLLLSHS